MVTEQQPSVRHLIIKISDQQSDHNMTSSPLAKGANGRGQDLRISGTQTRHQPDISLRADSLDVNLTQLESRDH